RVSTQTVVFAPRNLSRTDVAGIQHAYERASLLYRAPSESADARPMFRELAAQRAFGYGVLEIRGDWAHVRSSDYEDGWVRLNSDTDSLAFAAHFPELEYALGVAGYLRLRQNSSWSRPPRAAREWARSAFASYRRLAGRLAPPLAGAVAAELVGIMDYT